jgi:hypothetical protein
MKQCKFYNICSTFKRPDCKSRKIPRIEQELKRKGRIND